jgi:hypothetical protein
MSIRKGFSLFINAIYLCVKEDESSWGEGVLREWQICSLDESYFADTRIYT